MTHMWFGDLVTPKWWSWLWLSEAIASFWHMQLPDEMDPRGRLVEEHVVNTLYGIMTSDAHASSRPLTADVERPGEVDALLDDVTYGKGPFIIRMIHFLMGEDKFLDALNRYLDTYKFQNVEQNDLFEQLDAALPGVGFAQRLDPWVSQMGYPVVKVTRPGDGSLRLEQERFLLGSVNETDSRYNETEYDYRWDVPITMASSQTPNFTKTAADVVWMERNAAVTVVEDPTMGQDQGWYVMNVQQYGYYRVLYDQRNWLNLINQLNSDHKVIHPINRAQIINDAWNLVRADMLSMETALGAVEYLSKEVDYLPWRSFARELDYLTQLLGQSDLYTALESAVVDMVSGPLQELGMDITSDLDPLEVFVRVELITLACSNGHPTCVNMAQQQFNDWTNSGTNSINANLRSQFYCTGVERGGPTAWNFVLDKFQTETDSLESARLLRALSCARDPSVLRRLLDLGMRMNENQTMNFATVIGQVSSNRWGRDVAFQFLVEHFASLAEMLGPRMNSVIRDVTAHFSSQFDMYRLDLLESSGDTSAYAPAIQRARTNTATNMRWLQSHQTALANWLQREEEEEERINYRLPTNVRPRHYQVSLQPHIYGLDPAAFTFDGQVTIWVQCLQATDLLTLHVDRLTVSDQDVSVKQVNSQKELFQSSSYDQSRHFWHLQLTDPMEAGKEYEVEVRHFSGPLSTDGAGLYVSRYRDGEESVYLATTQMEPVYARKTFPCFDEPQLKATFDITLVRRNDTSRNYISLANAPYVDSEYFPDAEGKQWARDRFETTPIMPTYLLAFIVCDYLHLENASLSDPNVTYRTFARPNAIQWAERAQRYGLELFDWLDTRFKPPYGDALSKIDNVAVPDFSFGAMENWGLVIYRENILYQPGVTSASNEFWMASVITHELAHMWFGDYVSPKWWSWLWLNEAFASWWDVFVTEQVFPDWKVTDDWMSSSVYSVMESDALATSHPMTADVESPAEIGAIFDGVTYNKGSAVVRMMQFIMGLDTFIEGLNMYLANNLYGNAETSSLLTALDQVMLVQSFGQDYMTTKMHPWVSQMGYPVVMVTRTARGYHLTQKRFLIGSEDNTDDRYKEAPYNYQWEIPVIYATSQNRDMEKSRDDIHWLSKNSDLIIPDPTVNDTDAWILLNVHQMTYCRVLYDHDTWQALIGQLNRDPSVFPAINRGQIINDAWNLAKAGLLDMSVALSTLDFLQAESDLVPWRAFAREMHYVELMLERTDLFPLLQTYMQQTLRKPLQTLTLNIEEGMVPTDVFVRTLIAQYACDYGLVGCVNVAKRLFTEWKNTGVNSINANLRRQFYCTGVAEGDVTDWEFVYTQYKASDDTTELTNLRYALTCSKDSTLLRRLLSMTLDPAEIRTQDLASTIQYVADNPLGRDLAFQFFVDNFDTIKDSLEVLYFGRVLTSVTSHFNTDYNLQQLQQLSTLRDVTVIRPVVEQAIAQTRTNIAWLQTNYDVIRDWLSQREEDSSPAPGSYRLPTDLTPYHYDVRLQPHIYGEDPKEFFFEGNVTVFFTCTFDTMVITLHQDRLTIDQSSVRVASVSSPDQDLPVAGITEEEQFHFYRVHMGQTLRAGQSYSLSILNFHGDMRTSGEGLYLSSYKDDNRTIYLATTQMEPTYARQVFPCFDEPALKATFSVTLVRRTDTDRHYISLSNMPNVSSTVIDESWTADTFSKSMIMPTYLLAFIVCDYSYLSNFSKKYPVETRTYARPNRIADARTAQDYSVELFDWFEDHFNPNYEDYLPKVDHIAIPDFNAGAMENWGLITYRERLLYNAMSTASDRSWVAEVPSHELAHMWFGNKVSPKWWTWLWLNEAFADYWETYVVEQLYPAWKSNSVVDMAAGVFYAMQIDSYSSSHPLSNPVETPEEIDKQFDTITYTKGGAIIGMMHLIMGEHFIPALNVYLNNNLLGNAEHRDLFDSLDQYVSTHNGIDVNMTEKMEPWVTQMGYPVVNVRWNGDHVLLDQERFLLGSASPNDTGAYGYRYEVPITFTTSSQKNFTVSRSDIHWLRADGTTLRIDLTSPDEDWVVVNLRHEGYYRVNYDVTAWKALIGQLNADHTVFDQVNRAALMDDAFNLVKAELLPLDIALQTLDYMKKETDYGPWRVFARETDMIELLIERTELYADFQRFMQELVDEPLKTIGFDVPANNDPPIEVFKMTWIISDACKYDHVTCTNTASSLVSDWMNGLGNSINVNLRSVMYCTAVREGGHDVWDFIHLRYQEEGDPTEKSRLRSALGCSKDPAVLYTFLDMCLYEEEVPRPETPSCLSAVAGNRYGRDVALNFLLEHFPELRKSFSSGTLGSMVDSVTQFFHSNFHLTQLQLLRDTYDVSGIASTLERVQERTVTNMKWLDNNYDTVKQWLAAKTSAPSARLDYRLPTSAAPIHYDLELWPEIYGPDPSTFTFNGSVTILVEVKEPTSTLTLHSYQLDEEAIRESARILFENGTDTGYREEVTFDVARHFLILSVSRELRAGERFLLYMEFRAPLPGGGVGLYYTSYKDDDGTTVYLATTKFEAPYARRAFPCFDEPALKATVNVTLVRRENYMGRSYRSWSSNMLLNSEPRGDGYVADRFEQTLITPTYLLAFIVADFKCLSNETKHGLNYSTCARPNGYMYGGLAQEWGLREMEWLEDHFDPPYNMPKLDNMAIPDFLSGAMENWGLITYREAILYQEGVTAASDKDWTAEVVAHELAHMWFGNIVSPQWWNWLWLNEAFASFWDFHLVDELEPSWRMTGQFVVQSMHGVMSADSLVSSHPMTADVESPSEIQAIFDDVTYSKGAAIVRMMHFIMGQDDFIAGLNVYLHDRQYDVANHTHLFDALDKYIQSQGQSLSMTEVMEPWVTQMNFPVVDVDWTSGGQVTLTQRRFLSGGQSSSGGDGDSGDEAPFGYTWDIPVTMATSLNSTYDVTRSDITWFKKSQQHLTITDADIPAPPTQGGLNTWVLLNVQQFGYYRVNYPESNWMALIQQLQNDHSVIHPINRAQIINDAWSLARSGQLRMDIALETLKVLKNDDDYVPWRAISGELSYLDRMLSRKEIYGMFEDYMVQLVNGTYNTMGMTSVPGDVPIQVFQRERIVSYACKYGVQGCRDEAVSRFSAWKADPLNNKLGVDMRRVILCNGVRFGKKDDWDFVYQRYLDTAPGSEQSDLRHALSCSRLTWQLQKLMDLTLNSSVIAAQDVRGVLQDVSANPIGRDMAFTFLKQHFQRLPNFMTTGSFGRMVVALTGHFNTQHELEEVKLFMSQNDVSIAMTSFRQVVEQTSVNIQWMSDYYGQIELFLTSSLS
ncbi:uncharacterized protein LOC143277263 isoform X2 [Babylonia areolata]|uniref:uncharacterized protein LOC143277263 isoform X2 n=1 Tax=Babylonia areolata TaxID=304850 RepID=UPI003FD278F8